MSRNRGIGPEVFNALKLGQHFTIQTVLGYSTLLGGGDDGGAQTFGPVSVLPAPFRTANCRCPAWRN